MAIQVGIGSWADAEYVGVLYPKTLPAKDRLKGYAEHFDLSEVNSTYYAPPKSNVVENWIRQTPAGFTFDLKLHRAFSQSPKKTAEQDEMVEPFRAAAGKLAEANRFGTFFLVVAPFFTPDRHQLEELDGVIERLSPHHLAVELRHRDWVEGDRRKATLDFFRQRKLIWIAVDFPQIRNSRLLPAIDEVTNPQLAYIRLHGRNPGYLEAKDAAEGHTYLYSDSELTELAQRVRHLAAAAKHVHVVANNHAHDYAPRSALALKEKLKV